jgi:glycosyltransferase involved in cell wall biosynthesis
LAQGHELTVHVLLIPTWYPSPEDPIAGIFIRDQVCAVARYHDVTVVAPHSSAAPPVEVDGPVRTLRLPPTVGNGKTATIARLHAMSRLIARLNKEGRPPEILHAHTFASGTLAALLGRRWRLPVVLSEHDSDLVEGLILGWDARVARFAYRSAAVVCPVSDVLRKSIMSLEPRARCEVVGNVVDVDAFASVRRQPSISRGRRILAVSSLTRQKGLTYLLEAVRLLVPHRPDISLTIIGEGPERAALETQAMALPVAFLGSLPRAAVQDRMHEADVVAVPSIAETFGIVAVEALAAGLPVVTTSVAGTAELVAAYGGRAVAPADPVALSRALEEMIDRPDSPVPANAAEELRRMFSPEAIADSFDAIYRSIL